MVSWLTGLGCQARCAELSSAVGFLQRSHLFVMLEHRGYPHRIGIRSENSVEQAEGVFDLRWLIRATGIVSQRHQIASFSEGPARDDAT